MVVDETLTVIWPDDHIDSVVLAKLKTILAPNFLYKDCRDMNPPPDQPNAGVFVDQHLSPDATLSMGGTPRR